MKNYDYCWLKFQQVSGTFLPDDIHVSIRTSIRWIYRMELLVDIQSYMVLERYGDSRRYSGKLRLVETSARKIGRRCLRALQGNADYFGITFNPINVWTVSMRQVRIWKTPMDTRIHTFDIYFDSVNRRK